MCGGVVGAFITCVVCWSLTNHVRQFALCLCLLYLGYPLYVHLCFLLAVSTYWSGVNTRACYVQLQAAALSRTDQLWGLSQLLLQGGVGFGSIACCTTKGLLCRSCWACCGQDTETSEGASMPCQRHVSSQFCTIYDACDSRLRHIEYTGQICCRGRLLLCIRGRGPAQRITLTHTTCLGDQGFDIGDAQDCVALGDALWVFQGCKQGRRHAHLCSMHCQLCTGGTCRCCAQVEAMSQVFTPID